MSHFSGYEVADCDRKQEALDALDDLELALQLSHIYDDDEIEWVNTIRKYIENK